MNSCIIEKDLGALSVTFQGLNSDTIVLPYHPGTKIRNVSPVFRVFPKRSCTHPMHIVRLAAIQIFEPA